MIAQRRLIQVSRRSTNQLPSPRLLARTQRRWDSSTIILKASPEENEFIRQRKAVKEHAAATADFWRKLSLYVVPSALCIFGANTYVLWNEHWEHWSHLPPPSERPQYQYQNIRTKAYPWGDGDKTLFWNDEVNYHKKD